MSTPFAAETPARETVFGWVRLTITFAAVSMGPVWLFAAGMVYRAPEDPDAPVWPAILVAAVLGGLLASLLLPVALLLVGAVTAATRGWEAVAIRRWRAIDAEVARDAVLIGVSVKTRTELSPDLGAPGITPAAHRAGGAVGLERLHDVRLPRRLVVASVEARIAASLVDSFLQGLGADLAFAILVVGVGDLSQVQPANLSVALIGAVLGVGIGGTLLVTALQWILLVRTGQTLGKRLLGIRIVRSDGRPATFMELVLLRILAFGTLVALPGVGLLLAIADVVSLFVDGDGATLHDRFADTRVVPAMGARGSP